jgi:hypothetical protein
VSVLSAALRLANRLWRLARLFPLRASRRGSNTLAQTAYAAIVIAYTQKARLPLKQAMGQESRQQVACAVRGQG